jgi:hypothetical protein
MADSPFGPRKVRTAPLPAATGDKAAASGNSSGNEAALPKLRPAARPRADSVVAAGDLSASPKPAAGASADAEQATGPAPERPAAVPWSKRVQQAASNPPDASGGSATPSQSTARAAPPPPSKLVASRVTQPSTQGTGKDKEKLSAVIQAFARARFSAKKVHPLMMRQHVLVIQGEFREYLVRTRFNRNVLRRRRAESHQYFLAAIERLVQATRNNGREIAVEECRMRLRIEAYHSQRLVTVVQQSEEHGRRLIELAEDEEFQGLLEDHCPRELMDGTVDAAEFRHRSHIARLWRTEVCLLTNRHVAVLVSFYRTLQASQREGIRQQEAAERLSIIDAFAFAMVPARLTEVEGQDARLRITFESQRSDYVRALALQRLIATRTVISSSPVVPEGEPFRRARLQRLEHADLASLFDAHLSQRLRLGSRELSLDEGVGRRHILKNECDLRGRIAGSVVGVQLSLLQRDELDDVTCEFGARTAIRWAEHRARYGLQVALHSGRLGLLVPSEEQMARLRLQRMERAEYYSLVVQAPMRQFLVAEEVTRRRRIFLDWASFVHDALFYFTQLAVMSSELYARMDLLQLFEFEMQHTAATEYLWLVECDDRRNLAKALSKLRHMHASRTFQQHHHQPRGQQHQHLLMPPSASSPVLHYTLPSASSPTGRSPLIEPYAVGLPRRTDAHRTGGAAATGSGGGQQLSPLATTWSAERGSWPATSPTMPSPPRLEGVLAVSLPSRGTA